MNSKFQQVRIRVSAAGEQVRVFAETDKSYQRVKGIFVSCLNEEYHNGMCLGLSVGQQVYFEDGHETKLLTCGYEVAPNEKFFLFEEAVEAKGAAVECRLTDGGEASYPHDVYVYLWLVNDGKV